MHLLLAISLGLYAMAALLSAAHSIRRAPSFRPVAAAALALGVLLDAVWIATDWHHLGYPPFNTLHGCLVLLAGCIGVVSLSLELGLDIPFAGAVTSLAAAGAVLATMWFPSEAHLLPPALRSPYFAPHVLCYFIAYGALTASGLGGLVYLVALTAGTRLNRRGATFLGGVQSWMARSSQIGFPFLTLGIVLGALWAQVAFTDYWSWDPKEVWALVTWLLVAAHLHMTNVDDRRGAPAAALAVIAMAALYFTLFGVNYLPTAPQSLHTYIEP